MNKVVLLTGGNLGNRLRILEDAKRAIDRQIGSVIQSSPIVESEAWGFESADNFLNQVLVISTEFSADEVLKKIQEIELSLGRIRKKEQWVSRYIDIDILFYNDDIFESEELTIPHRHIQDRKFTLFALNKVMADYHHPVLKKSIKELLKKCSDKSKVEVYHA